MNTEDIRELLDAMFFKYCQRGFILNDPISIPHQFTKKEDIDNYHKQEP